MAQATTTSDLQPYYQKWIDANRSIEKMVLRMVRQGNSTESVQAYVYDVAKFAEAAHKTPDELLSQKQDWASLVNGHLDELIVKRGVSPSAGQRRYHAIKRWLTVNDIDVAWRKVEAPKKRTVESSQVPRREELRLICGAAGLMDRVLVLVAVSSGLRVGTITKLQLKHIDLGREIPCVRLTNAITKNRKSFLTFISPETKQAIEAYLREREGRGEPLGPESYLITKQRPRGQPIETRSVQDRWENMLRRVKLYNKTSEARKWHVLHFHLLRKYYKTWATLSGMNIDVVEYTMGHRSGVKNVYFVPDEPENIAPEVLKKLEAEYRKAIPALTILSDQEKVRELEGRLEEVARDRDRDRQLFDQQIVELNEKLALLNSELARRNREGRETGRAN